MGCNSCQDEPDLTQKEIDEGVENIADRCLLTIKGVVCDPIDSDDVSFLLKVIYQYQRGEGR